MDLKPAAVTLELASAALASPALQHTVKLAEWVGDGREIIDSGLLRPAVAEQACADLGIGRGDTSKKLRSAQDVPALVALWCLAWRAGLITVDGKRARGVVPDGPDAAVEAWLRCAGATFGEQGEPCGECLTASAAIAQAGNAAITVTDVLYAVAVDFPGTARCPDCGEYHDTESGCELAVMGPILPRFPGAF